MANPGDLVRIFCKKEVVEGRLVPSGSDIVMVKLASGYNLGFKKGDVKKVEVIETHKEVVVKAEPVISRSNLPLVSILHTGGTIASKVDYSTGAVVAKFNVEDLVALVPELKNFANIRSVQISNLQSESMRFGHFNLIAKAVDKEIKHKPKGIIVTHGTDVLHYSSAALSFMLNGLEIPVIFVGAQRSSDRPSSDSWLNLVCAAKFITETDFKGVAVCMHSSTNDKECVIIHGCRARKLHTSRRDAFRSINAEPIATVSLDKVSLHIELEEPKTSYSLKLFKDVKVGLLKTHPNIFPEDLMYFKNFDGLIIEGTGLGHAPTKSFDDLSAINEENKSALAVVLKKAVVVMSSQCIFGVVNLNVYTPQRELQELGVLSSKDMHSETAFIKLAWLLSNYGKNDVKKLFVENLRGEISDRITFKKDELK